MENSNGKPQSELDADVVSSSENDGASSSISDSESRSDGNAEANEPSATGSDNDDERLSLGQAVKKGLSETLTTLRAFIHAPREILSLNIINIIEGMAYFGTLTYLVIYMHENVGVSDTVAAFSVSLFTMTITISQLLFGGISDKLGAKRALGVALICLLFSRVVVGIAEPVMGGGGGGLWSPLFIVVVSALLIGALSYGLYQPSIYSVTRQFSDERTSAVSYAMLYAGMNLGAFVMGLVLPIVRRQSASLFDNNGYSGSLCFLALLTFIALGVYYFFIYRSKGELRNDAAETSSADGGKTSDGVENAGEHEKLAFWERLKRHPLADLRFDFFIFILIPVQTLFAYQNILIPTYLTRCFGDYPTISENFETFSNLNPLIVFIAAPIIAALTARANVYKMMIIGTTVMALPTFLLVLGQTPVTFLAFVLCMSIGESMWQPRFLQHVAEIAPKDRVGAYIGIAQLPWFLTKFIVGLYVGYFMENFIPDGGAQYPESMWLIFACVAMISPVALFLARKWVNVTKRA